MAGAGAKKQFEANRKKLSALRIAIAVGIIAHALIRMVLRQGYLSKWHWIGFGATFMLEAFAYSAISRFAEPEYSESGELLYGGADLNMGGMCGYWHDLLYIRFVKGGKGGGGREGRGRKRRGTGWERHARGLCGLARHGGHAGRQPGRGPAAATH